MNKIQFQIQALQIPMKISFRHASASREVTESVWVQASRTEKSSHIGLGEGCPRSYVTGEKLETALSWAQDMSKILSDNVSNLIELKSFVENHRAEIDLNPSAWCALELAMLDLFAKEKSISLEQLLKISDSKKVFHYSAVLSADSIEKLEARLRTYRRYGFMDYKLKVLGNESHDLKAIETVKKSFERSNPLTRMSSRILGNLGYLSLIQQRLRLDGNNAWSGKEEELYSFLNQCSLPIWAIEEPFQARDYEAMSALSQKMRLGVILDESLCRIEDFEEASKLPARWIANVRVSKMGGLLRSLALVEELKANKWEIIVGAQVGETSVLTRAALTVAQACGKNLVTQEGAAGTRLLQHDMTTPVLMFGLAGRLHHRSSVQNGSGLYLAKPSQGASL